MSGTNPSAMVSPGWRRPSLSARSRMYRAIRALIEPDGFRYSSLTQMPSTSMRGVEHGRAGSRRGHGPGLLSRASWGHPPCGCLETPTCRRPQRAGRSTSIWTGGGEVNSLQTMGQRSVRRASAVLALVVIAPLLVACSSGTSAAPTSSQVTITRDHAGIPHIRAANFTALGYGEAWAFSQDNFCTLAEDFVTVNGERSRYFGPNGPSLNYSAGAYDSNLDSDFFWQSIKASGVATAQLSQPPPVGPLPHVLEVYRGYVAGYNAYLRSGNLHDPRCAGTVSYTHLTLTDMLLRGVQITTEASSAQFIADEVQAAPPSQSSAATSADEQPSPTAAAAEDWLGGAAC